MQTKNSFQTFFCLQNILTSEPDGEMGTLTAGEEGLDLSRSKGSSRRGFFFFSASKSRVSPEPWPWLSVRVKTPVRKSTISSWKRREKRLILKEVTQDKCFCIYQSSSLRSAFPKNRLWLLLAFSLFLNVLRNLSWGSDFKSCFLDFAFKWSRCRKHKCVKYWLECSDPPWSGSGLLSSS